MIIMEPKTGTLVAYGGSLGLIVPKEIVDTLGLNAHDTITKTYDPLNHRLIIQFPGYEKGFTKKKNSITPEQFREAVSEWKGNN